MDKLDQMLNFTSTFDASYTDINSTQIDDESDQSFFILFHVLLGLMIANVILSILLRCHRKYLLQRRTMSTIGTLIDAVTAGCCVDDIISYSFNDYSKSEIYSNQLVQRYCNGNNDYYISNEIQYIIIQYLGINLFYHKIIINNYALSRRSHVSLKTDSDIHIKYDPLYPMINCSVLGAKQSDFEFSVKLEIYTGCLDICSIVSYCFVIPYGIVVLVFTFLPTLAFPVSYFIFTMLSMFGLLFITFSWIILSYLYYYCGACGSYKTEFRVNNDDDIAHIDSTHILCTTSNGNKKRNRDKKQYESLN